MTQKDFVKAIGDTFTDALDILKKKNSDYAAETDPWKNFRFAELVDVGVERAILVRMSDKLARISNILNKETQVKDESIMDTLVDLVNYSAILKVYIDNEKKSATVKA